MKKAEVGLYLALAKFQEEMDFAKKDSKSYGYNYTDYASVVRVVREGFKEKNLSFIHLLKENENGTVYLTTRVVYACQESNDIAYIESSLPLQVVHVVGKDGKNKTNDLQGAGSGITYLKRYTLQSLVGLPSEDDDGKSGQVNVNNQRRQSPPPQQPVKQPFTREAMEKQREAITKKFNADITLEPTQIAEKFQLAYENNGWVFNEEMTAELKSFCSEIYNNINS